MKVKLNTSHIFLLLFTSLMLLFNSCNNNNSNPVDHEYVTITGGEFQMGSEQGEDKEKPIHSITLGDFKIGKYEVTNAQYCEFLNAKGNKKGVGGSWLYLEHSEIEKKGDQYSPKSGFEKLPVVVVSWDGAVAFSKWKGARLPTEAEWEYVARGGISTKGFTYAGSNQDNEVAWNVSNSENKTHLVGTKQPNELGVYDMSGNVWEWCSDLYDPAYYRTSTDLNPQGSKTGTSRVLRGGSWRFSNHFCRVSARYSIAPGARNTGIGFRIVSSF